MSVLSFFDAAYKILKRENRPMSANEIVSMAISEGFISSRGRTPSATMGARIYTDIKQKGDVSKFQKVGRGKFGLRQWGQSTKILIFPRGTFKSAAYEVLKSASKPLGDRELTKLALNRGLLRTSGKTPTATMGAQLYTDIKKLGNKSRFIQLGKNRFGLREWGLGALKEDIEKVKREKALTVIDKKRSIVGDPINFKGLMYGPLNENGVIFLFSKIHNELGLTVEAIQPAFPDAKGRRKVGKGLEDVWIEFEYKSSAFRDHGHDPKECDIIVCWEHDWKDCPSTLEVIELKSIINKFKKNDV